MSWIPIDAPLNPDEGIEMIAFHPDWIDEDFNPKGIRIGFFDGDGSFVSAKWIDHQDSYIEDNTVMPTHYMELPENPTVGSVTHFGRDRQETFTEKFNRVKNQNESSISLKFDIKWT